MSGLFQASGRDGPQAPFLANRVAMLRRSAGPPPEASLVAGIVKRALAELFGGQTVANEDQRRAFDRIRCNLGADVAERSADDPLVRPAGIDDDGDRAVAP